MVPVTPVGPIRLGSWEEGAVSPSVVVSSTVVVVEPSGWVVVVVVVVVSALLAVFVTMPLKWPCIMRLVLYLYRKLPTYFSNEAILISSCRMISGLDIIYNSFEDARSY